MVGPVLLGQLVSVVSGIGLLSLAAFSLGESDTSAARSFAVLLGVLGGAALCGAVTAHTGTVYKVVWLVTTLTIPVAFAVFAFDYYGLRYFGTRARFLAAVAPAAAGILGGAVVTLGTPTGTAGGTAPVRALATLPGFVLDVAATLYQVGIYYTTALILVALGLVLLTVYRYRHLDARLGPTLAFVGVWPWFAYLVMPRLVETFPLEVVLVGVSTGYATSVVGAAVAVYPLDLFDSTPGAGNVGPSAVLDSMDDAVVVVDDDDTVLRLNAVACRTFGTTPRDAVGGPLSAIVDRGSDSVPEDESVPIDTVDGTRQFEVTRTAVTDRTEAEQGSALIFRDVTRRRTREQRLEVLNRVLRHNLRNDATTIIGRAELVSDGGAPVDSLDRVVETTNELVDTANRAREIEQMMTESSGADATSVNSVVDRVVADVTAAYPVETTTALPDDAVAAVDPGTFETVVRNLVENAAEHNDADEPIVVVSGDRDGDRISLAVSDNGPGIPDHERAILERGDETDLSHGSGLGLWAVHWGVVRMGGDLSFSDNDPRGSVVTVSVPAADGAVEPAG